MSELKLISPLLDNYDIGSSISSHNGVACYPAMKKETTDRYIIKNISVPASQTQLEALLLTGAYPDADSALSYFHIVADGIIEELEALKKLSQGEGFTGYDDWQLSLKEGAFGYDVCMVGTYKYSLRKYLQHNPITHLTAMNLGLDICQALSDARKEGFIYVDLKPNNIYVDGQKFKIGDLGFLRIDSLKYASIPDKYFSYYTAPEALDAFTTLSPTIDIYALGLILYQAYNGGDLPFNGSHAPAEIFAAPIFADYEMSEIILKACNPNPEERWQTPDDLRQALVSYMQRNGANDVPIVPPKIDIPDEVTDTDDHDADELAAAQENNEIESEDAIGEEFSAENEDDLDLSEIDLNVIAETADVSDEPKDNDDEFFDLSFLNDLPTDETTPENNLADVGYDEISDELSEILTQADELVSEPNGDVVATEDESSQELIADANSTEENVDETTDISVDENIHVETVDTPSDENLDEDETSVTDDDSESIESEDEYLEDEMPTEIDPLEKKQKRKRIIGWILTVIIFLLIAAITTVGFLYYKNIYLLPIDAITVDGNESSMIVQVDTEIDEAILSVICSDSHGNQISSPVVNGAASFTNLTPNTAYTVRILVDGFHRLTGETAASYSTPAQTNVIQFNAVTGSEPGSAILSFELEGPDTGVWKVSCAAEGEEAIVVDVLSHQATLTGLTIGKEYVCTLIPGDGMYVTGETQILFTASELVYAENVLITGCIDGKLTVTWDAPEGIEVPSWTVRCYDDQAYNQTAIISDTTATFENVDPSRGYTVEVTAANMSVSERAFMSENAITISDFTADSSMPSVLTLSWNSNQVVPAEGYVVFYSVEGSDLQSSVSCTENTVQITPVVPGAKYNFKIQQANGMPVLSAPLLCEVPDAQDFSGYGMTRGTMSFQLCKRPEGERWYWSDLSDSDITSTFAVGQRIGILGQLHGKYGISNDPITALFIIRDADGNYVCHSSETRTWSDMWELSYGEIDIPQIPTELGSYTVTMYFNGLYVTQKSFTIV